MIRIQKKYGKNNKELWIISWPSSEQWLIIFLVSRFFFDVIGGAIDLIFGNFFICHVVIWGLQFLILAISWKILIKKPIPLFFAEMLSLLVSCYGFISGHIDFENGTWLRYALYQIVFFVPMAIAVYRIKNKRNLLEAYYKIVPLCAILTILSLYLNKKNDSSMSYDQYAGYLLLFATLVMGTHFFEKRKCLDFFLSLLSCFAILLYCSRGPLLAILIYALVILLMNRDMKIEIKVVSIFICAFVVLLLFLFYPVLLDSAIYFSDHLGINSRTLYLLKEEPIHWSGRDSIINTTIELIKKNPILGCGAYGWKEIGGYPHNIFFEMILAFGIPSGVILCFVWLFMYVRGFLCIDDNQQRLIFIFGCYCFQLFWSGSFLIDEYFFVFIGLCMAGKSRLRIITRNLYTI